MKQPGADLPVVVTRWYAYAKWVLERVESFPKSQRFILGQRLSNHVMDVLETLVKLTRTICAPRNATTTTRRTRATTSGSALPGP